MTTQHFPVVQDSFWTRPVLFPLTQDRRTLSDMGTLLDPGVIAADRIVYVPVAVPTRVPTILTQWMFRHGSRRCGDEFPLLKLLLEQERSNGQRTSMCRSRLQGVLQTVEAEQAQYTPQEQVQQHTAEQIVNVSVSPAVEEIVEVPRAAEFGRDR